VLTQNLISLARLLVPTPRMSSPRLAQIVSDARERGADPSRDAQVSELRLVVAYSALLVAGSAVYATLAFALPSGLRRALAAAGIFFAIMIATGMLLHLARYYRLLMFRYRRKARQRRGNQETSLPSRSRPSSDRDLVLQAAVSVIVLGSWLLTLR
jgi:hypothetical protein